MQLVVISIIAMLAAMLLPAVAQSVSCLSSLRQVGMAAHPYAQDRDGVLPSMRVRNAANAEDVHWFQQPGPCSGLPADGASDSCTTMKHTAGLGLPGLAAARLHAVLGRTHPHRTCRHRQPPGRRASRLRPHHRTLIRPRPSRRITP